MGRGEGIRHTELSGVRTRMMERLAGPSRRGNGLYEFHRQAGKVPEGAIPEAFRPTVEAAIAHDPAIRVEDGWVDPARLESTLHETQMHIQRADHPRNALQAWFDKGRDDFATSRRELAEANRAIGAEQPTLPALAQAFYDFAEQEVHKPWEAFAAARTPEGDPALAVARSDARDLETLLRDVRLEMRPQFGLDLDRHCGGMIPTVASYGILRNLFGILRHQHAQTLAEPEKATLLRYEQIFQVRSERWSFREDATQLGGMRPDFPSLAL